MTFPLDWYIESEKPHASRTAAAMWNSLYEHPPNSSESDFIISSFFSWGRGKRQKRAAAPYFFLFGVFRKAGFRHFFNYRREMQHFPCGYIFR
jgi:hypothetical protein